MAPAVSVVMSVYNGGQFLNQAVESILAQTLPDFEFIIINDGSTDRTGEILERFTDERIVRMNQDHAGLTRALNRGLSAARGDYIARIDADDMAQPERLEKQLAFLQNNPDIILVGSNCHNIDRNGTILSTTNFPGENAHIKWRLLFHNCIPHSSVMFHKEEILKLGGYDNTITCAQDYDLWLRVAEKYSIANLEEPLVSYRIPHEAAISSTHAAEQKKMAEQIQQAVFEKLHVPLDTRWDDVRELCRLLYFDGTVKNIAAIETLFAQLYSAFCHSAFAAGIPPAALQELKIDPYTKLAWLYCAAGSREGCIRCIHEALDSGFQGVFQNCNTTPDAAERFIAPALEQYYSRAPVPRASKKLLAEQFMYFAWKYYHGDDMKNFRRCVARSFFYAPSVTGLMLLVKSVLGKTLMEHIHTIKTALK
jgi:hypothetical protein